MESEEYKLIVIQEPGSLSSCSFYWEKLTRRVISPCPIFQLVKKTQDGFVTELEELGNISEMVAHLSLLSIDDKDVSVINTNSMENNELFHVYSQQIRARKVQDSDGVHLFERLLEGTTVSNCYFLTDIYGKKGAYFIFEDLSVRMEGTFKLKASVNNLSLARIDSASSSVCSTTTQAFKCFPLGTILERKESSEISKHFAEQGVRIPIKHKEKTGIPESYNQRFLDVSYLS